MIESTEESAAIPHPELPDELPPVQPPSAGFIVQLFVFPALIVMAVVAIWWMFGLIAVGEQDWRKLLQELQSQNLHIRNRAMFGLAQILEQDTRRGDQGQHLIANREIAAGLSEQLTLELRKNSSSKDAVAIQEYLTRSMGMFDALDITSPALIMAMEPQRDIDIRKSAIVSLSYVAGRALERNEPLDSPQVVQGLIEASNDQQGVIRHVATFALGLFRSPEATQHLHVLLSSGDPMTRFNAAIGCARQGSTAGFAVIREALSLKSDSELTADDQFVILKNILKAVTDIAPKLDENQREEILPLVNQLATSHPEIRIQVDATGAANALKAARTTK